MYALYSEHTPGKPMDCYEFRSRGAAEEFGDALGYPYWIEGSEPDSYGPIVDVDDYLADSRFYHIDPIDLDGGLAAARHNPDTGECWATRAIGHWFLLRGAY